jgi:hypothetical protein
MRAHALLLAATFTLAIAAPAVAQPIARVDVSGVVGWFNAHAPDPSFYDDWYNRSAYGGAELGWYWTDHLKTEVDLGATSPAELYGVQPILLGGRQIYVSAHHRFSTRRIAAGQQYQFGRNAWAHPHVAVGIDVTAESRQQRLDSIVGPDQTPRTPVETTNRSTHVEVRPFAEVGTKFYFSRRGFVRTDFRLTFHNGVDEVLVRFGVGVDLWPSRAGASLVSSSPRRPDRETRRATGR